MIFVNQALKKNDIANAERLLWVIDSNPQFATAVQSVLEYLHQHKLRRTETHVLKSAVNQYRQHGFESDPTTSTSLQQLISEYWRDVDPDAVVEAIEFVMSRDKEKSESSVTFMFKSPAGVRAAQSRFFVDGARLMPILEAVAPAQAISLRNELVLQGFKPDYDYAGAQLITSQSQKSAGHIYSDLQKEQQIREAATNPQRLLSSLDQIKDGTLRLELLSAIISQSSNPDVIEQVIRAALAIPESKDTAALRMRLFLDFAKVALSKKLSSPAREIAFAGLRAATQYFMEIDSDRDDPNRAIVMYWPSAFAINEYVDFIVGANLGTFSAIEGIVPDSKLLLSIVDARSALVISGMRSSISITSPMISHKNKIR